MVKFQFNASITDMSSYSYDWLKLLKNNRCQKRNMVHKKELICGVVILVSCISHCANQILRKDCILDADFSKITSNVYLPGHLMIEFSCDNVKTCIVHCITNRTCQSLGYHNGMKRCALFDANVTSENAVIDNGWTHFETDDSRTIIGPTCETLNPCPECRCEDICEEPGYKCTCDTCGRLNNSLFISHGCKVKLGGNKLEDQIANYRDHIDWKNLQDKQMVCKCAEKARALNYKTFGLQFWGECWASKSSLGELSTTQPSMECSNARYEPCTSSRKRICLGKASSTFLYSLL